MADLDGDGDCFEVAAWLVVNPFGDIPDNAILVHGEPVLLRPPFERFDHAWVEIGDEVIDRSNGLHASMPRSVYYHLGQIHEEDCKRYTKAEAKEKIQKYKHWGPWPEED